MKKKLLPILMAIVILSALALTACQSPIPNETAIRWENGETSTYKVSLLAVSQNTNNTIYDDKTFARELQLVNFVTTDEVRPSATTGTYTTTITQENIDGDNFDWMYTTELSITNTYVVGDGYEYAALLFDKLTEEQKTAIGAVKEELSISFTITETQSVVFSNNVSQTPINSKRLTNTYYLGKINQSYTNIDYTCTYADGKATVGDTVTELPAKYLDVAQIALYGRSINQATAFQVAHSVAVFNPYDNSTSTLTYALQKDYLHMLNIGEDHPYAVVNLMTAQLADGRVVMAMYHNPKDLMISQFGDNGRNKYTTVKIQSGMYVYEVGSYTQEDIDNLRYTVAAQ